MYANLFDRTQEIAVVRAVYWDGEAMRKSLREQKDKKQAFRLKMAARSVQISHSRLEEWLTHLQGASVNVDDFCGDDRTVGIGRLRIERDYLTVS